MSITCTHDGYEIRVWDLSTGKVSSVSCGDAEEAEILGICPYGDYLYILCSSDSWNRDIIVYRADGQEMLGRHTLCHGFRHADHYCDGDKIEGDLEVSLWNLKGIEAVNDVLFVSDFRFFNYMYYGYKVHDRSGGLLCAFDAKTYKLLAYTQPPSCTTTPSCERGFKLRTWGAKWMSAVCQQHDLLRNGRSQKLRI